MPRLARDKKPANPHRLIHYIRLGRLLTRIVVEGVAATYLDNRIKVSGNSKPLDVKLADHFIAHSLTRQAAADSRLRAGMVAHEQATLGDIVRVYKNVWRWHGTGRYEYRAGEGIVDVLERIIQDGGLLPQPDTIDPISGAMQSISTARARMYARPYADMHRDKSRSRSYRYGRPSYWGKYFMAPVLVEGILEAKLWRKDVRVAYRQVAHTGLYNWRAKINQTPRMYSLYETLDEGSDIAGNYPILIGLKHRAFEEAQIAKTLRRHESRSTAAIPLERFTHLEVPYENIPETRRLLALHDIANLPVVSLEAADLYCSKFAFSMLVSGRALIPEHAINKNAG